MEKYNFPKEPVANPESVVAGDTYRFTLINDTVLRYEWAEDGAFEDRASTFAINRQFPKPEFTVDDKPDKLVIRTSSYQVTYNKKRFDKWGLVISFTNKNTLWGADWRYGETPQNLGGTTRTLDDVDGRCPLEPGILSRAGFSVHDDSESMLFTDDGFVAPRKGGDRIDGYLFCYGHDYTGAMKAFFSISGKQPLLPRWALGNWWSRYYAYSDKEYLGLMDRFAEEKVPLSVAVIDMDWHEVAGDHIGHAGWTGYTWEKKYFPDPRAFTKALHDRKLKITLNDHPHAGVHSHEAQYEAMAKELGHDTSSGAPIHFNPASPEFMYAFLNTLHRDLEEDGCDFWWIDWQQGPYSSIKGLDPLWLLNHFHFLDHQLQQENVNRSLIFSRYAGLGSHRYPIGFSGDSIMTWESLAFQPEFTATAANVGFLWSHDIGGHYGGYRDDELAARWVQLGVFSPIMRLHSSNSPWASKEPWLFRTDAADSMRRFLRLRHTIMPYLYSASVAAAINDEPLVRPLYWTYPERDEAYGKPNQYHFGTSLIVAPIVQPRDKKTNLGAVDVWVPPGRHVDIQSGVIYDGDREIRMYRDINHLPILAPEGSIIPLDKADEIGNGCTNPAGYVILVVVGKDGRFIIHEDTSDDETTPEDSKADYREIKIVYDQAGGKLTVKTRGHKKSFTIRFLSLTDMPSDVTLKVDGNEQSFASDPVVEETGDMPGLVAHLPEVEGKEFVISLGSDPQLTPLEATKHTEAIILDAQMDMNIKDKVWAAIKSDKPVGVKVGQLTSLGLDEELIKPLVELLVADSRQK